MRVAQPVSPRLEITALCHRSLLGGGPALRFDHPAGHDMPVLGNLFGSLDRVLAGLELDTPSELRKLGRDLAFLRSPGLPESLSDALGKAPGFARLAHLMPVKTELAAWQQEICER